MWVQASRGVIRSCTSSIRSDCAQRSTGFKTHHSREHWHWSWAVLLRGHHAVFTREPHNSRQPKALFQHSSEWSGRAIGSKGCSEPGDAGKKSSTVPCQSGISLWPLLVILVHMDLLFCWLPFMLLLHFLLIPYGPVSLFYWIFRQLGKSAI